MGVTIYHNPRCSKSRQAVDIVRAKGTEPVVVEYLKNPPSYSEVLGLFEKLNIDNALPMIRLKEAEAKEAGISKNSAHEDLLKAIVSYPKLLERPIVISDKGARICRPAELVEDLM